MQRKSSFFSQLRRLETVNSVYHVIEEVEQTPWRSFTSHLVSNKQEQHERKGSTERKCILSFTLIKQIYLGPSFSSTLGPCS